MAKPPPPPPIHEAMRERLMERFSILPFSIGCISQSAVDVIESQPTKQKEQPTSLIVPPINEKVMKSSSSLGLVSIPKANMGVKLHRLVKGLKSLSQIFQVDGEEEEEEGEEMEIGLPTDVQHVGHVGWNDGCDQTVSTVKSWDRGEDHLLLSLPSLAC